MSGTSFEFNFKDTHSEGSDRASRNNCSTGEKVRLTDGVRHESSSDSDSPSKEERQEYTSILAQQHWLQGEVEAKVHATVDEDAHGGDGEASVRALDAIRLEGLHVDIDQTIELALTTLTLGIVGQPTKLG